MFPLVRSLLALAALLAVVNAQSNCAEETFGDVTDITVTLPSVDIPARGGRITIQDACRSQHGDGSVAVGEKVRACLLTDERPPVISEVNPPDLSPVDVQCPDGCPSGGVTDIVQYCSQS